MITVKEGKVPPKETLVGSCDHCGGKWLAAPKELQSQADGRNGTDYYCTCPTQGCNRTVYFYRKGD